MPRVVAAFDFDGTVSRRDTLVPFVARVAGLPRSAVAARAAGWAAATRKLPLRDRDAVKAYLVEHLLAGRRVRELERDGGMYAARLIDRGLRPEVVDQVRRHVAAGHETLFVSASLVYYLRPIARYLHMADVIAVEPEVRDGVLTGAMHQNVRAHEKAHRLREWLGVAPGAPLEGIELWAYGNSSGDHELLALADHGCWLGNSSKRPPGVEQFTPGSSF